MEDPLNPYGSVLERLTARINELEQRVFALEHPQLDSSLSTPPALPAIAGDHLLQQLSSTGSGTLPAIGKVFLGIAGAYLLRAVSESGTLPSIAVVIIAFAYAASWLVWASRIHDGRFVSAASATTAALIFSAMVWELTMRFRLLSPAISAATLVGFVMLAAALAWRHKLISVVWPATVFSAVSCVALLVATRDPAPFALAMLLIAFLTEYSGYHDRWRSLRPIPALSADLAIVVLIAVYSGEAGVPQEYKPIATAALLALTFGLFIIYASSILISTVVRGRTITTFEIGQAVTALLLAIVSVRRVTHDGALPLLAVFCLLAGSACYLAEFTRFDHGPQARNYHVFATWGAAFLLFGSSHLSQSGTTVLLLDALAALAIFAAMRWNRWSLGFHAAVYLGAAAYFAGLWGYAAQMMTGALPAAPGWQVWITVFSAVICCAIVWRAARDSNALTMRERRIESVLRLFFSSLTTCAAISLSVTAIVSLIPGVLPLTAPLLAVIRTFVLCATILVLVFSGIRWKVIELVWIAYAAIAFCTLKLVFEDLRQGTAASLAISLFLYGTVWVLVPRLLRSRSVEDNAFHATHWYPIGKASGDKRNRKAVGN